MSPDSVLDSVLLNQSNIELIVLPGPFSNTSSGIVEKSY
jgi:hypothetical protein